MAVHWQCTDCQAYKDALEHDEDSAEWRDFYTMRNSLIHFLLAVQFPPDSDWVITEENWQETYLRLNAWESVVGAARVKRIDGEKMGSCYFEPYEIQSMIGLQVNAGTRSREEINAAMMRTVYEKAERRLNTYLHGN